MRVPCRVQRGGGQSYYFDGVHAMTLLGGGIGGILAADPGFDLPLVQLSTADFDALQDYLQARDTVFAQQIANAVNG